MCVCVCVCAVDFSEAVPLYCVPSFAGRLVRYTWKLSIGASRGLNADAKIIRIPFQVMTVPGEWLGGEGLLAGAKCGVITCVCEWLGGEVFWQGQSVVLLLVCVSGWEGRSSGRGKVWLNCTLLCCLYYLYVGGGGVPCVWLRMALMCG